MRDIHERQSDRRVAGTGEHDGRSRLAVRRHASLTTRCEGLLRRHLLLTERDGQNVVRSKKTKHNNQVRAENVGRTSNSVG